MQAGVATDKAYTRKLEAKLSASRSISDLHARCSQYKLKLRELAQELEEAESRTASVQEIADVRADEVHAHTLLMPASVQSGPHWRCGPDCPGTYCAVNRQATCMIWTQCAISLLDNLFWAASAISGSILDFVAMLGFALPISQHSQTCE